jgi:hypothetical protein
MIKVPTDHANATTPSRPQRMVATSMAGCPLRIAGQPVHPSHTGTPIMARLSNSHRIAKMVRLGAPGCDMWGV